MGLVDRGLFDGEMVIWGLIIDENCVICKGLILIMVWGKWWLRVKC